MAINYKEFVNEIESGLKANKTFDKFMYRFKKNKKTKRGILNYSDKSWDKRTRISKAKVTLAELKEKEESTQKGIDENSTLNKVAEIYFKNRDKSNWTEELKSVYSVHIKPNLGDKKIKLIRRVEIDNLVTKLRKKGHTKQTEKGCSPRTIKKVIIECLKPILSYALDNKIINELPSFPVIKLNKQKQIINDAKGQLESLWNTINKLYKDDPFYKSLFYFSLFGRRWGEVKTIEWSDINFNTNKYTIRAENNKVNRNQTYDLPLPLRESLIDLGLQKRGLIFKSPKTGKELHLPKYQISKIKKESGIEGLHLHGFRHILVSALAEMGADNAMLSGMLGHLSLEIVNRNYLSNSTHIASIRGNEQIVKILKI